GELGVDLATPRPGGAGEHRGLGAEPLPGEQLEEQGTQPPRAQPAQCLDDTGVAAAVAPRGGVEHHTAAEGGLGGEAADHGAIAGGGDERRLELELGVAAAARLALRAV